MKELFSDKCFSVEQGDEKRRRKTIFCQLMSTTYVLPENIAYKVTETEDNGTMTPLVGMLKDSCFLIFNYVGQ